MTLQKRLDAVEAALEERIEERLEEELTSLLSLLEQHLSREEFLKVAHILARGPSEAKEEGEG